MTPEQSHALIACIPFLGFTVHVMADNVMAGVRFIRSLKH